MQFDTNLMHLVTCHMVNNLTSSVVLGIDWLMEHQPEVDWPNYTVTLHLANSKRLLIPGLAAGNNKPTFVVQASQRSRADKCHPAQLNSLVLLGRYVEHVELAGN